MSKIPESFLNQLKERSIALHENRTEILNEIASAIKEGIKSNGEATVKFICTHNSRRSQTAEFLLDVLARQKGLPITALSAGTEFTSFYIGMVEAITSFGFKLIEYGQKPNPLYIYQIGNDDLYYYSKTYEDDFIKVENPIIITVCDSAKETCPIIPGTFRRLHLEYRDPKFSDGTAEEGAVYRDKVLEIGAEMFYLISRLSQQN